MENAMVPESLVTREGNSVYTTSLIVAEKFGKRHECTHAFDTFQYRLAEAKDGGQGKLF